MAVAPLPSAMSRVEWTRECALTTPQQAERAESTLKKLKTQEAEDVAAKGREDPADAMTWRGFFLCHRTGKGGTTVVRSYPRFKFDFARL